MSSSQPAEAEAAMEVKEEVVDLVERGEDTVEAMEVGEEMVAL